MSRKLLVQLRHLVLVPQPEFGLGTHEVPDSAVVQHGPQRRDNGSQRLQAGELTRGPVLHPDKDGVLAKVQDVLPKGQQGVRVDVPGVGPPRHVLRGKGGVVRVDAAQDGGKLVEGPVKVDGNVEVGLAVAQFGSGVLQDSPHT